MINLASKKYTLLVKIAAIGTILQGCRSTTPMSGVTSTNSKDGKSGTSLEISLRETSDIKPSGEPGLKSAAPQVCIFGASIDTLANSSQFELIRRGTVERMGVTDSLKDRPRLFAYTEYLYRKQSLSYSVFNTFRKEDDGGMTVGWIERSDDQKRVAEIVDGEINHCDVLDSQFSKNPSVGSSGKCLFGYEIKELFASKDFGFEKRKEILRRSRLSADGNSKRRFRQTKLSHLKSGAEYLAFLRPSEANGSENETGWIEAQKSGDIVAIIGESEILQCSVDVNAQTYGTIKDNLTPCIFGADLHDLEISPTFSVSDTKAEVLMTPRIGAEKKLKSFKRRTLVQKNTGNTYIVFNTFKDEDDKGATLGWVETIDGRIVAEIFENGFRNCEQL